MRFFKTKTEMNWKYIIGELVLIFLGITLAIGFNNWNADNTLEQRMAEAIGKITIEIKNNMVEQARSREINSRFLEGYEAFSSRFQSNSDYVLASADEMSELQTKYPDLFMIIDSTIQGDQYLYEGGMTVGLSLPELSSIAWNTTKTAGINIAMDFDCLYVLEKTYNLQTMVEKEAGKATDRLIEGDINKLIQATKFWMQFDEQLKEDYQQALEALQNCQE